MISLSLFFFTPSLFLFLSLSIYIYILHFIFLALRFPFAYYSILQIVIDENLLAEGYEYMDVSTHVPSPDHTLLAYAVSNS